jgi:translocation and assembly module TamA
MRFSFAPLLALLALPVLLARPVAAAIRIDINGVDAELRHNVEALLSLERYKERERLEADAVQRLYRRAPGEVRDALRPYGYYAPKVTSSIASDERQRNWRVQISIEVGEPVLLESVSVVVHGAGASDNSFERIATAPGMRQGERLQHAAYDKLKTDLQAVADTYGYLDARMLRSELRVDPQALRASVFLEIETGERYSFGATTITQSAIREAQIRRYLRYHDGEGYDAVKLLRTQFALDDSQFFSTVEVTTGSRDPATHLVPIEIRATRARNSYSFGAGYGTDTGVRGTISWLNPRVNDRGHRMRVQLQVSEAKQNLNARYDIPFGDPVREKFSMQLLTQEQDLTSTLHTREVSFRPSITQSRGNWQRVLSASFAHNITTDNINGRREDNLIVPGITYSAVPEGYLGEDLFSRKLYTELIGSHSVLGANANFLRFNLLSEQVLDLSPRWHLLLRGEVGTSAVGDFQELPAAYRFFAGGDRSVRGFAFNSLSPRELDPATNTLIGTGGRHLLTGTVELERDLPHNLGVALFTDFGNAFNRFGDPLAYSLGLGFRWRLPVITVGIDVAKPLRAPGFPELPGPRLHLNISPKL